MLVPEPRRMPRFKALDLLPSGSVVTTGFGWDSGPVGNKHPEVWPRIHHAIDRAGPGIMTVPVTFDFAQWIPKDSLGCSVLRLINPREELRLLHINVSEMEPVTLDKLIQGKPLNKLDKIAPCGNTGMSFGDNGGRHVHYTYMVLPGSYDDELIERFGDCWKQDKIPSMLANFGPDVARQIKARRISWMNSYVVCKVDPYWEKLMYVMNTEMVFE